MNETVGTKFKKISWLYLLCTYYLFGIFTCSEFSSFAKKNEWKFEIFFTLIFIHTLAAEQDFEFLLQSGVSIVCSGSSIGLFQAYYIPSRQSQVHLRSTHSFICHPPAVYLGTTLIESNFSFIYI